MKYTTAPEQYKNTQEFLNIAVSILSIIFICFIPSDGRTQNTNTDNSETDYYTKYYLMCGEEINNPSKCARNHDIPESVINDWKKNSENAPPGWPSNNDDKRIANKESKENRIPPTEVATSKKPKKKTNLSSQKDDDKLYNIREKQYIAGLAYPGLVLGLQTPNFSFELRGYQDDISQLYGLRATHHLYHMKMGNLYWGGEALYIGEFEGQITEGDGSMFGGLAGIQIYTTSFSSFNVDAGPYYLQIKDDLSGVEVDMTEFVMNSTLSFHF